MPTSTLRGHVLSDLHLLSGRARTEHCTALVQRVARRSDVLVLNGDIFDFAWCGSSLAAAVARAGAWLTALLDAAPCCRIHVLLGNHDCIPSYRRLLAGLAARHERLVWRSDHLRLGPCLFLHGDVAQRRMDGTALAVYRARWAARPPRPAWLGRGYAMLGRTGLDGAAQRAWFRPATVARRIHHHLSSLAGDPLDGITDVYSGHTHQPFRDLDFAGRRFHNSGSGVRGAVLDVLPLRLADAGSLDHER